MISVRSLFASAWMGVQHDLAWTTPLLSLLLQVVAPFASAMSVSMIYWFGTRFSPTLVFDAERLAFVMVGSTLYAHVAAYAWVPTVAIAEGKNLAVFPHIYLTSRSTAVYVTGRMLSSFVISVATSMIALAAAYLVLGSLLNAAIPLAVNPASVALLAIALVANLPGALALGYLLGAYSLYASKFEWSLPGYVAGLLMVFSGALFSTSILPWPLSTGANYLPYTQFIAAARSAILPGTGVDYWGSILICLVGGLLLMGFSLFVYLAAEQRARRDGVLDRRLA
jgi:ABC-type polysaccharide/polyol phosphate export permease